MSDISDIERISAELEIRNLIAKVFLFTDTAPDVVDHANCFTEDAVWERVGVPADAPLGSHLGGRAAGREGILADRRAIRKANAHGPGAANWHMATNVLVSVTGKDTAKAWLSWIYVVAADDAHQVAEVIYYADDLRRTEEGWKIARRRFTLGKPPPELAPQV
jgi:ketosteroid isomerase-like protein